MKKALTGALIVVIVALAGARVALPVLAKRRINAALAHLEGYGGRVADVDFALWRGRVSLDSLEIWDSKKDLRLSIPYIGADIAWGPLFKRTLVADVAIKRPRIRLTAPKPEKAAKKTKQKAQKAERTVEKKTGKTLPQLLSELMPFRIDKLTLADGQLELREGAVTETEREQKPDDADRQKASVRLSDIGIVIENLTNSRKAARGAYAKAAASARVMDTGAVDIKLDLDPTEEKPTFDLAAEVRDVDMAALSPVFRWQWDVEVERGTFAMVCAATAKDGGFKGYVKPFLKDFKMGAKGRPEGAVKKVKEAVVNAVARVLENDRSKAVATKVPFEGRFDDPKTGVWEAVVAVLRNAFIKALTPTFEKP